MPYWCWRSPINDSPFPLLKLVLYDVRLMWMKISVSVSWLIKSILENVAWLHSADDFPALIPRWRQTDHLFISRPNHWSLLIQRPASAKPAANENRQGCNFGGQKLRGGIWDRDVNFGIRGYLNCCWALGVEEIAWRKCREREEDSGHRLEACQLLRLCKGKWTCEGGWIATRSRGEAMCCHGSQWKEGPRRRESSSTFLVQGLCTCFFSVGIVFPITLPVYFWLIYPVSTKREFPQETSPIPRLVSLSLYMPSLPWKFPTWPLSQVC